MTNFTLAVDPGTEQCGVALFRDKVLDAAALVRAGGDDVAARIWVIGAGVRRAYDGWKYLDQPQIWTLVVEQPVIHRDGPQARARPGDILTLAQAVGAVIMALPQMTTRRPRPSDWKGGVKKGPANVQVWEALAPGEREVLVNARVETNHNVLDAVGIGLWACRRPR